jgi:DNA-binding LytR/AlgR family response regulator
MTCIIIDDEPGAHVVLSNYIDRLHFLDLKRSCFNVMEAYEYLKHNEVDLIFLDINLPEVDGFALLDMIEKQPLIIVTTAYTDFAYKGYETNCIDYLHKPIRFERFVLAVEKAQKWAQLEKRPADKFIEIRYEGKTERLLFDEISYFESLGNYVKMFCKSKVYVTLMSTKELESKLPVQLFVRVHKSYIVNLSKIEGFESGRIKLGETLLPVGKTYKKYVENILKNRAC